LQALLDINSTQTEKELAEQLGVTQQAISVRLHTKFYKILLKKAQNFFVHLIYRHILYITMYNCI